MWISADRAMRGLFVTGTDTGVGKTLVAAALARFLTGRGIRAGVMKPVESGVDDPDALGADGRLLCWAAGMENRTSLVSPYRFAEPVAPSLAAELQGTTVDPDRLAASARQLAEQSDFLIVEGAGGLLAPLAGHLLMADLACRLGFPLLIVCRAGLGTLNHTLLTLEASRQRKLPVAGLLVNGMPESPGLAERHAPRLLTELCDVPLWGVLGQVKDGDERQKVVQLAGRLNRFPHCNRLADALRDG
jgi:dethiobiotin synthetase